MKELITKNEIDEKIHLIRGMQVMLDHDLAELYGVSAKRLNEQVKRNLDRFPEEFRFQLATEELENLRSQNATSSGKHGGRRKRITKQLRLDLDKYNAQYPSIELLPFDAAHDRFLILDHITVYHIGASLKDLGKKWFAFSKIEKDALKVIGRLE